MFIFIKKKINLFFIVICIILFALIFVFSINISLNKKSVKQYYILHINNNKININDFKFNYNYNLHQHHNIFNINKTNKMFLQFIINKEILINLSNYYNLHISKQQTKNIFNINNNKKNIQFYKKHILYNYMHNFLLLSFNVLKHEILLTLNDRLNIKYIKHIELNFITKIQNKKFVKKEILFFIKNYTHIIKKYFFYNQLHIKQLNMEKSLIYLLIAIKYLIMQKTILIHYNYITKIIYNINNNIYNFNTKLLITPTYNNIFNIIHFNILYNKHNFYNINHILNKIIYFLYIKKNNIFIDNIFILNFKQYYLTQLYKEYYRYNKNKHNIMYNIYND